MLAQRGHSGGRIRAGGSGLHREPFVDHQRIGLVPGIEGLQRLGPFRRITADKRLQRALPVGHIIRLVELGERQRPGICHASSHQIAQCDILQAASALACWRNFKRGPGMGGIGRAPLVLPARCQALCAALPAQNGSHPGQPPASGRR